MLGRMRGWSSKEEGEVVRGDKDERMRGKVEGE